MTLPIHLPVADVIVTVTSYGARLEACLPALESLLRQTVQASRTVLWVGPADRRRVPRSIRRLRRSGLEIEVADRDRGSATKLLPALQRWPESTIVTADDDCCYHPDWLSALVAAARSLPDTILAHRTHWMGFDEDGSLLPYRQWERNTTRSGPSPRHFVTGVGGVLYPPGSLSPVVLEDALRARLCPTADDVWFNGMARLQGTPIARVPGPSVRYEQTDAAFIGNLSRANVRGNGNDRQIRAMVQHLGPLWAA